MLAAHWESNPNVIYFKAKGSGGANEMTSHLQDNEVMYALGEVEKIYISTSWYFEQASSNDFIAIVSNLYVYGGMLV